MKLAGQSSTGVRLSSASVTRQQRPCQTIPIVGQVSVQLSKYPSLNKIFATFPRAPGWHNVLANSLYLVAMFSKLRHSAARWLPAPEYQVHLLILTHLPVCGPRRVLPQMSEVGVLKRKLTISCVKFSTYGTNISNLMPLLTLWRENDALLNINLSLFSILLT